MPLELEHHKQFCLKSNGALAERLRHGFLFAIFGKALLEQKKLDPARLFEKGLFAGEIKIQGIELIPKEGPLLVVANHDNTDLLNGGVQIAGISYTVWLARKDGAISLAEKKERDTSYVHWIQAAGPKDSLFQWALPLAKGAYGLISKCFDSILVDRDGQNEHTDAGTKMLRIWNKGGAVGLFPEGDASPVLQKIDPKAGKLLHACQRISKKIPLLVVPMAGWMEHGILRVRVGPPLDPRSSQNIGGLVMQAIENLLPPEKKPFAP